MTATLEGTTFCFFITPQVDIQPGGSHVVTLFSIDDNHRFDMTQFNVQWPNGSAGQIAHMQVKLVGSPKNKGSVKPGTYLDISVACMNVDPFGHWTYYFNKPAVFGSSGWLALEMINNGTETMRGTLGAACHGILAKVIPEPVGTHHDIQNIQKLLEDLRKSGASPLTEAIVAGFIGAAGLLYHKARRK